MYSEKINSTPFQKMSHSARFDVATDILAREGLGQKDVLDFGTGDGKIFTYYLRVNSESNFTGYDISNSMLEQADDLVRENVELISDLNKVKNRKYSYISCLETLEHIPDEKVLETLLLFRSLLEPDGTLVISVPIESGISSLLKQIIRRVSGQSEKVATPWAIFLSTIYLTSRIKRDQRDPGHTGFDYLKTRRLIENSGFMIKKTIYSPFGVLRGFINSQIFWVCK